MLNVYLGFDIRDICKDRVKVMEYIYDFSIYLNLLLCKGGFEYESDYLSVCNVISGVCL